MPRRLALLLLLLTLLGCRAPQPPAGSTTYGDTADAPGPVPYADQRFHFLFTPPSPLRAVPLTDLHLDHPTVDEIPLYAARDPKHPYGITAIAERIAEPPPSDPKGYHSSRDFIRRLAPEGIANLNEGLSFGPPGGFDIDELSYRLGSEYHGAAAFPVTTPAGAYLIVFKCTAANEADLRKMLTAISATRHTGS